MKLKIFFAFFAISALVSTNSQAQYNPFTDGSGLVTVGVGVSGWGIPVFARYEHPVADNITVGGDLSFQTKSYAYWRYTYYGASVRGSYHFNEMFEVPDEWDFYAGASLGFYLFNGKYINSSYSGPGFTGANTANIGAHAGARYFFNEKFSANAELGGGSGFSGATIGVTIFL